MIVCGFDRVGQNKKMMGPLSLRRVRAWVLLPDFPQGRKVLEQVARRRVAASPVRECAPHLGVSRALNDAARATGR